MIKSKKIFSMFLSLFLLSCSNQLNPTSKIETSNINSNSSNQLLNTIDTSPQGPNSTGGLFTIYDKNGRNLINTKIRIQSESHGNLNPISSDLMTDSKGEVILDEKTINSQLITDIKNGNKKIIVTVFDGDKEVSTVIKDIKFISDKLIQIKVEANISVAKSVNVDRKSLNLVVGKQADIFASVEMSDGNKTSAVTWTSSDESVAVVKDGKVSALKQGVTIITVSSISDPSINNKVVVTVIRESSVSRVNIINPLNKSIFNEAINLKVNTNFQLEAIDTFDDGTNSTNIIWKSSDETILSVGRNNGLLIALRQGKVTITATSTNDIKKTSTLEVNVIL